MTQGTKIPIKEAQKVKSIAPARVVPELTKQIIEFASDQSYAYWDEYQEKLLRDSESMLEEVVSTRKLLRNIEKYLLAHKEGMDSEQIWFLLSKIPEE